MSSRYDKTDLVLNNIDDFINLIENYIDEALLNIYTAYKMHQFLDQQLNIWLTLLIGN